MADKAWNGPLDKIDDYRWMIPTSYNQGMRVPGVIYANESLLESIRQDRAPEQVANVAFLPGIVKYSLAMPDIHWGYGFSIGGVAAMEMKNGVISPGGVGYDINCGVRLLRSNLREEDIKPRIKAVIDQLFRDVPSGVGSKGQIKVTDKELKQVLEKGSQWAVKRGFGNPRDLEHTEAGGCLEEADVDKVSREALKRGYPQLGSLGSGNHFLEVQVVEEIFDPKIAKVMGLEKGQVTVMIHCGSRGLGHQVCDDYIRVMQQAVKKYKIELPDRQLACAPIDSPEGRDYFAAMACAANYAWANRQCIMHWTREALKKSLGLKEEDLGLELIYDVAHNIAKFEQHIIDGKKIKVCVHRKGATRSFGPGHPEIPKVYSDIGQPVLIPGDMGRYSYVLVGTQRAMEDTFGSTCHGAGRLLSRTASKRRAKGRDIAKELASQGIYVRAESKRILAEEMSEAYKNVRDVVDVTHNAGISLKVAKMRPLGVIKG